MLDLDWVLNSLKEARDDEDWDLVKEIISYIEEYEEFVQKMNGMNKYGAEIGIDRCYLTIKCSRD